MDVVDNPARSRFEIALDGDVAVANYHVRDDTITFLHTEVPAVFRGRGIADILAAGALDSARARALRVVPTCPFFAAFIRKHPGYQDLVATTRGPDV